MGNQTPTFQETIRRNFQKQKEDVKELFHSGEVEKGVKSIINYIAFTNPVHDIIVTLAIAKATEIIKTKNIDMIKNEIKASTVNMTPSSFITNAAIKYAEKTARITLDSKNRKLLENSLIGAVKSRLED